MKIELEVDQYEVILGESVESNSKIYLNEIPIPEIITQYLFTTDFRDFKFSDRQYQLKLKKRLQLLRYYKGNLESALKATTYQGIMYANRSLYEILLSGWRYAGI